MTRSRIGPARTATTAGFRQTIILPPAAGSPGAAASSDAVEACENADLAVAWVTGIEATDATYSIADGAPAFFAATGTICPDTEWDVASSWAPDVEGGTAPTIEAAGATAWQVTATAPGLLTVTVGAILGGVTIAVGTLTLQVEAVFGWIDLTRNGTRAIPMTTDGTALDWFYYTVPEGSQISKVRVQASAVWERPPGFGPGRYSLTLYWESDDPDAPVYGDEALGTLELPFDGTTVLLEVDEEYTLATPPGWPEGRVSYVETSLTANADAEGNIPVTLTLTRLQLYVEPQVAE